MQLEHEKATELLTARWTKAKRATADAAAGVARIGRPAAEDAEGRPQEAHHHLGGCAAPLGDAQPAASAGVP